LDITSDGQFTNRKVWRSQRPEWFLGKQEPVEGQDYTTIPYSQWNTYQTTPEYTQFKNRNNNTQLAEMQYGGGFNQYQTPQPANMQFSMGMPPQQGYQPVDYSQNFAQNNPAPSYSANNFAYNTTPPPVDMTVPPQQVNPLAADAGSGYQVDDYGNPIQDNYDKTRFANIYGGFDIPSAAYKLGQGIETGNAFDIATGGLKLATGLGRNIASGMGQANRRENIMEDYYNKARKSSIPMAESFQDGGAMGQQMPPQEQGQVIIQQVAEALQGGADPQQILQQLVSSGIPQEEATALIQGVMQQLQAPQEQIMRDGGSSKKKVEGEDELPDGEHIAELEKGEHFKKPNGEIKEVEGEKHSNGGTKLTAEQLPDGSQIISDHLKVGKDGAKKFNNDYDLGIKSTDTYATIIDKFNRKSGIKKINDEQEIVLKNIEKQTKKLEENPSSASTIKLNLQLFTDQLAELEEEKAPLVEARKVLFDEVFQPQEESKQTHNAEVVQEPIPQEQMATGGIYNGDMIMEYSKKHNLHPDRVREIMQKHQVGELHQYQDGGERLNDFYKQSQRLGYTGKKQIGDIQQWMAKNYPDEVVNYFTKSGQPLTAKHVDIIKSSYKDVFNETGISPTKASAEYTSEEKSALQEALGERANKEFLLKGFTDNKWDWRAPVIGLAPLTPAGMVGTPTPQATANNPFLTQPQSPLQQVEEQVAQEESVSGNLKRGNYILPNLPDQSPLLPDSLQGALKMTHRYDRVETPLASPEAAITEIRRQEQSAMQGLQNLPDAQKAAAIAQIQANTQNALNQAVAQTTGANQQAKFNTDVTNSQIQMKEEGMRNNDLQNYENKILKADAITQANLRNYYNAAQKVNVGNYNYVQGLNLINDRYDNAQFTGDGSEMINLQKAQAYDSFMAKTAEQRKAEADAEIKAQKKLAVKSKKRFGGVK